MNLYAFGYLPPTSYQNHPSPLTSTSNIPPTPILRAHTIKILWSSWCDILIVYRTTPTDPLRLSYRGTTLSASMQGILVNSPSITDNLSDESGTSVEFFGSALHHGIQGYTISSPTTEYNPSRIIVYSSDAEIQTNIPALRSYPIYPDWKVTALRIDSREEVLASITCIRTNEEQIFRFKSLTDLAEHLAGPEVRPSSPPARQIGCFAPTQWCATCTTSIALDTQGQVCTASSDSRYQKCLARSGSDTSIFEAVPYFSETRVKKIAAGGYMAAAISEDDELFIWGHANPGSQGSLSVLGEQGEEGEESTDDSAGIRELKGTRVSVGGGYQDDIIKSMEVFIDGGEAIPYDVAIGNGHVLVAAEVRKADGTMSRVVFGAGANDRGQIGLSSESAFSQEFEEIVAFRNMSIEEVVATGWSTYIVVRED